MRVAFDAQLFLKGNKTGIAWCADNLIKVLSEMPDLDCQLNYFSMGSTKERKQLMNEYLQYGAELKECRWFKDTWYRLLQIILPIPYSFFFREETQITQFFNYVIPPGVKGKKVTIIHDMAYLACPQFVQVRTKRWLDLMLKRSCRRADAVITVSEFSKREIIKYMDVSPDKITVIPNAVDRNQYHTNYSASRITAVKKKYGITGDYLLYLGTIEPRKNVWRIVEAYEQLAERIESVPPLILAGGRGWRCESIYEYVARIQAYKPDAIRFIDYIPQEDAPLLIAGALFFVFPSLYEGFGMPIIESMACGTPVISSNITSMPEIIGDAGMLVDPYSVEEMSNAMEALLFDKTLCDEYRRRGLDRVKRYTWERSASILKQLYLQLVQSG